MGSKSWSAWWGGGVRSCWIGPCSNRVTRKICWISYTRDNCCCCCSSRLFAIFAIFARTAVLEAASELSESQLVRAKIAKRREAQHNDCVGKRVGGWGAPNRHSWWCCASVQDGPARLRAKDRNSVPRRSNRDQTKRPRSASQSTTYTAPT